jgi:MFS transporter, MHS family, proline/betaine transporter
MSHLASAHAESSEAQTSTHRKAIIAVVIGCTLEWFDFSVFNFFVVQISRLFFPAENELTSVLLTIATFGIGLVLRPVGGVVLGVCGDKFGRKSVLSFTIVAMAASTAMIGLAPTYAQAGIVAPVIIVLARALQGFASGGEMGSGAAFLTEISPPKKVGFFSSWMQVTNGSAVVLGATVGVLTGFLAPADMDSWGWRIPFLFGVVIGPIGFFIRRRLHETPAFDAIRHAGRSRSPLREVLSSHPRELFATFFMVVLFTVSTYTLLYYMPTYAVRTLHLKQSDGFASAFIGGLVIMVVMPIVGILSDRLNPRAITTFGALAIFSVVYPMFEWLTHHASLASLTVFQVVLGILYCVYTAPLLPLFHRWFPTRIFATDLSTAYNFAVLIFGGFASLIITWLLALTGNTLVPAFYVMGAAVISLFGSWLAKPNNHSEEKQ